MATFILTSKSNIDRPGGFHFDKGGTVEIHIHMQGLTPNNLFNNSRCKEQLLQQFRIQGFNLPPNDPVLNAKGCWDIKML